MRNASKELVDVLSGSVTRRVYADVFHGSDRVATGLALTGWALNGDLNATVGYSGSGTFVIESVNGESWSPSGTDGVLSPFRATVELVMEISANDTFVERVSLGLFRLDRVPKTHDTTVVVAGETRVVASTVACSFVSLDEPVRRNGFERPVTSPQGASAWDEIRRLAAWTAVEETVPDVMLPTSITWEAAQGGRLKAIHELGRVLGGVVIVNSRGAFTVIPDTMGEPVGVLRLRDNGTVTEIGSDIDTDGVYNIVVGTFEDANRNPIYASARVPSGPLDPTGVYGPYVRYYSSDLVKTQAQADNAVQAVLAESINSQMYDVLVQCHVNPLVEIGDVWRVDGWDRPLAGRVVKVGISDSELMMVTLRVKRILT